MLRSASHRAVFAPSARRNAAAVPRARASTVHPAPRVAQQSQRGPSSRALNLFRSQSQRRGSAGYYMGVAAALVANAEENDKEAPPLEDDGHEESEPPALEAKYVIIGGGTAAFSAIKELKRIDPSAKIVVISEEFYLPYQRPPLTKELWRTNDPNVTTNLTFTDWQGKEASVFYESDAFFSPENNVYFVRVNGNVLLSPERHMVQLPDGASVKYEKCLIATGAKPFARFAGDWQLGDTVTTYRNLEDFQALHSLVKEGGKTIAIAGGGFLGSELAWAIAKTDAMVKNEIIQIVPESGIMANLFPKYLSDHVTDKLRAAGVNVMTGRMVAEISNTDGKVNIKLDNDQTVAADHLILAAGVIPDTRVAHFCELELDPVNRGIVANSELQVRSDLFVVRFPPSICTLINKAGDVASYFDYFLGRRRVEHYEHAVESGKHAAQNMAGAKRPYTHIPMFWGDLGTDGYEAVGIIDSRLRTVSVWETPDGQRPDVPEFRKGSIYYISKENRVAGVLNWNNFGKVESARAAIRRLKQYENPEDLIWAIDFEDKH